MKKLLTLNVEIPDGFEQVFSGPLREHDKFLSFGGVESSNFDDVKNYGILAETCRHPIIRKIPAVDPLSHPVIQKWIKDCKEIGAKIEGVLNKTDYLAAAALQIRKKAITDCLNDLRKSLEGLEE